MGVMKIVREQFSSTKLIWSLAKSDFKTKYLGSYFGLIWEMLTPLSLIFLFWFVFEFALGIKTIEGYPFLLWFVIGLIPWFFFSDAWGNATNAFTQYSFLVKKMVFKTEILPSVKILSSFFTSIIFHVLLVIVLVIYGEGAALTSLLVIYYLACTFVLIFGLSLITSSIVVLFKDMKQLLTIILQFGIYLTPILWSQSVIPSDIRWVLTINPMFYIVDGYRTALLGGWEFDPVWTAVFWATAAILLVVGGWIYERFRPHFADVL